LESALRGYLYLDTETYSATPIKHGVYRYLEDPEFEMMVVTYAFNDTPVKVWDRTASAAMPADLYRLLHDDSVTVVCHNAQFDRNVLNRALGTELNIERTHCVMAQALAHGLPGGLDKLSTIYKLDVEEAKDKRGKTLVKLFCTPRPRNNKIRRASRDTHPAEWQQFLDYAVSDINAVRAVHRRLPQWNNTERDIKLWHLDQTINQRGIKVDTRLARKAIEAVSAEKNKLAGRTSKITSGAVSSTTQRDVMLEHLLSIYNVDLPDMQASTLERRVNDDSLPAPVRELLAIRLEASTTSVTKYTKLLNAVSEDGRLRGTLQYCGAARTGRWAGRLFQPQNLPRPKHRQEEIEDFIKALYADGADLIYGDLIGLASSALRGCIVAPDGHKLCVSDLSNIEGRDAAWLSGEEWKLQAFRDFDAGSGHDLYALAYAKAFGITAEEVMHNKKHGDGTMRQVGKVMELMLAYQGGVGAFLTGAAGYNIDLEHMADKCLPTIPKNIVDEAKEMWLWSEKKQRTFGLSGKVFIACDALKRLWRNAHPATASYWPELEAAAIGAVNNPGNWVMARRLAFRREAGWLLMRLPSGRMLCYASPKADNNKLSYMGVSPYSREWKQLSTYGGKLFENACQAVARDVMAANMPAIEQAGYRIVLSVHDELLTEAPDTPKFNADQLSSLLAANPDWALTLPLAAGGFEHYRYRKD
jgi:DNA polymerase bacteriophage-type